MPDTHRPGLFDPARDGGAAPEAAPIQPPSPASRAGLAAALREVARRGGLRLLRTSTRLYSVLRCDTGRVYLSPDVVAWCDHAGHGALIPEACRGRITPAVASALVLPEQVLALADAIHPEEVNADAR